MAEKVSSLCRSISSTDSPKLENASESECQICLSNFDSVNVSILPCHHIFCHKCLVKLFLQRDFNCPTCRKEIEPDSFTDPGLVDFCKRSYTGAVCFRCETQTIADSASWCSECAAVFCEKCAQTDSDPDAVSKAGSRHIVGHKMTNFSLKFGAQVYLQMSQLMLQQVELAATEEPARVAKISAAFSKKLIPLVAERLEKEIRENYFIQGSTELQQAIFLYSLGFRSAVGSDVKLIQFLHDAKLSETGPDFSGTDWSKIMKSGEKLNKLIKCVFNFELTKKDPNVLKAMLWNKNPNYFDSGPLFNQLNSFTTADYQKFADNLIKLTSIKAPSYSMLIYDNILTRKGDGIISEATNSDHESESAEITVPIEEYPSESGFSRFKHFLFGQNRRKPTGSTPGSSPKKQTGLTSSSGSKPVKVQSRNSSPAGAKTSQSAGQLSKATAENMGNGTSAANSTPSTTNGVGLRRQLVNEDGESLQFMGQPLSCEGRRIGICEPSVLSDDRILLCNTAGGFYVFDKDLKLSNFVRIKESYRDLKFDANNSELLFGLESKEKNVFLKVLNLEFEEEMNISLPIPQMEGVRCIAFGVEALFFLESRKLFRVSRNLLKTVKESGKTKLEIDDVITLVEQTEEDIQFSTFFFYDDKVYVSSRIQDEILLFDSQTGKIIKRIHSKIFNRPLSPMGICKDEFGNIIVKDLGGLVVFDLETGAFKGLICEQELNVNLGGELCAKDGWVYQASHQGLLIRWEYCRPEMAANKADREFFKGECEPETKTQL